MIRASLFSCSVALGLGLSLVSLGFALRADDAGGATAPPQDDATDDAAKDEEPPRLAEGRVLFKGELPEIKELTVPEAAAEGCCPPGEEVNRTDMSLLISEERGIANCVVTVTVEGVEVEIPEEATPLDQKGCRFQPHLIVVPKGAKVAFLNSDETSHNVHIKTILNEALNQTVLGGKKVEAVFEEAETIKVECDMHSWMNAWVVVTDATHWSVTDAEGRFALEDLPPGTHEATVWHETLGKKTFEIVVGEDGEAEAVEVELEKEKSKSGRRRRRR